MLTSNGSVKLSTKRDSSWLNRITFGKLGRSSVEDTSVATGEYNGATKTQMIRNAGQLRLPSTNVAPTTAPAANNFTAPNTGINIGLGLPEASAERITSQSSTGSTAREANVDPQNTNPTRRTTLPESDRNSILLTPSDTDMNDE